MELKRAVPRVSKFCAKKQGNLSRLVRLIPADGAIPARVWAFDGRAGCLCYLDKGLDVPECLVDSAWLGKAVRGSKVGIDAWLTSPQKIVLKVDGVELEGEAKPVAGYMTPPEAPELELCPDFQVVPAVAAFAASFEPYSVVRFGPDIVEATDTICAIRGNTSGLPDGLVPAETFKAWPAGKVLVGATMEAGFYRVGDELRVGYFQKLEYPDLSRSLPLQAAGTWTTFDRQSLLTAVERAVVASDHGSIELRWAAEGGQVSALADNGTVVSVFKLVVWDSTVDQGGQSVMFSGKPLVAVLKAAWSLRVLVRLGGDGALRLESGPYTVCVWPIRPAGGK